MPQVYDRFRESLECYHQQMVRSEAFLQLSFHDLKAAESALVEAQMRDLEGLEGLFASADPKLAPPKLSLKKEMAPRKEPPEPDVKMEELKVHELYQRNDAPVASSLAIHFGREAGGSKFFSSPAAQELGDEFYVVLNMAQNIDHLALRAKRGMAFTVRFAIPENYAQILGDLSQRLDQWPGQFPQTQKLLADMSAAIKDQQLVSGLKEALREQTNLSAPAK